MVTIILILGLVGCTHVKSIDVLNSDFAPRAKDYPIQVINSGRDIGNLTLGVAGYISPEKIFGTFISEKAISPHILISQIWSSGAAVRSWESLIENAKNKAREQGGDAVIIRKYGMFYYPEKRKAGKGFYADVIRFR